MSAIKKVKIIINIVCDELGIDEDDLMSGTHARQHADARSIIAFIMHENLVMEPQQIANELCVHRSTVYDMISRYNALITHNNRFYIKATNIINRLRDEHQIHIVTV